MKRILLILPLFLFASCISTGGGYVSFEKSEFYEVANEDSDDVYYFSYPQGGVISRGTEYMEMNYSECSIKFDEDISDLQHVVDGAEVKTLNKDNVRYDAWYFYDRLGMYRAYLDDFDYEFMLSSANEDEVSRCIPILEMMAESFTDKPFYYNDSVVSGQ